MKQQQKTVIPPEQRPICGIVMPISAIDGCPESHWLDVLAILSEAIKDAGFDPNIVSDAEDVGIIQKRIIQNLYDNPIVVCDVSGKNPNVMFELGLRLAFDKPTIIVKDDKTTYSFDTAPIEHLDYPRDLRFSKIVDFKQKLAEKIKATHHKSNSDSSYTTFLKNFGEFTVAKLDKKEVSGQEYILEELQSIRASMRRFETQVVGSLGGATRTRQRSQKEPISFFVHIKDNDDINNKDINHKIMDESTKIPGLALVDFARLVEGTRLRFVISGDRPVGEVIREFSHKLQSLGSSFKIVMSGSELDV